MAIEAGTSTYYQAKRGIVQDGLVLHLDAGVKESYSGGNVWRDLSGNGYNGTIYNSALNVKTGGGSLQCDGANDYIGVSSPSSRFSWTPSGDGLNSISIEMWVKSSDSSGYYLSKPWNGSGWYNYLITYTSLDFRTTQVKSLNFSSLATGNWENIVCIATPTQVAVYRNGSINVAFTDHNITANSPGGGTTNQNNPLTIMTVYPYGTGTWNIPGHAIQGNLSVVRIYNKVLSADEVSRNYNATRHRFGL